MSFPAFPPCRARPPARSLAKPAPAGRDNSPPSTGPAAALPAKAAAQCPQFEPTASAAAGRRSYSPPPCNTQQLAGFPDRAAPVPAGRAAASPPSPAAPHSRTAHAAARQKPRSPPTLLWLHPAPTARARHRTALIGGTACNDFSSAPHICSLLRRLSRRSAAGSHSETIDQRRKIRGFPGFRIWHTTCHNDRCCSGAISGFLPMSLRSFFVFATPLASLFLL